MSWLMDPTLICSILDHPSTLNPADLNNWLWASVFESKIGYPLSSGQWP